MGRETGDVWGREGERIVGIDYERVDLIGFLSKLIRFAIPWPPPSFRYTGLHTETSVL